MLHWLLLAGVYAWLGFTVGYFFRKWFEGSLLPRYRTESGGTDAAPGAAGSAPGLAAGLSSEEPVDWVDEADRVLAVLPRREIRRRNLLHRVTATFVFHPDGRMFLQQRTPAKDVYPGLFDPFVGGTVASGESYPGNAAREVAEELGVHGAPLYFLFGHGFQDASTHSLIRVFACIHGGPVRLQEAEVAGGEWAGEARVEQLIAQGRVCPDSAEGWRLYRERYGAGRNFARDIAPGLTPIGRTGDKDKA
jgi:isopentenyldiphosphate isomerase